MASLPLHPRLAHLAVRAEPGARATAAALVAILSDRDPARRTGPTLPDVDLRLRIEGVTTGRLPPGFELEGGARARLAVEIREWRHRLRVPAGEIADPELAGRLLATAYPDRIAQRRGGQPGRFLLENGRGAVLPPDQPLARADFLAIAEIDDAGSDGRILLAAPVDAEVLDRLVREHGGREERYYWDPERRAPRAVEQLRLGAIVLAERVIGAPDPARCRTVTLEAIRREGIDSLPWSDAARRIRARLAFLRHHFPAAWPDVSSPALIDRLDEWLGPAAGAGSIERLDLGALLLRLLAPGRRAEFDREAPDRWKAPTGSSIPIDYSDPSVPAIAIRLQEMFGQRTTPSVASGRVPLTVQLLSPAGRPVQVTRDLTGFWRTSYFDVRKELKGRYPKHDWPEDPLEAAPTRRPKRRP